MTNDEGIAILAIQKGKIATLNQNTYRAWISKTAWIIKELFGEDVGLYGNVLHLSFNDYHGNFLLGGVKIQAEAIIDSAVEMVKYREIPKDPPKLNFIYRIKNEWLIVWVTLLIGGYSGAFFIGKEYGRLDERLLKSSESIDGKEVSKSDAGKKNTSDSSNNEPSHYSKGDKGDTTKH